MRTSLLTLSVPYIELMVQNGIGVLTRPLYLLDIDEEFFRNSD